MRQRFEGRDGTAGPPRAGGAGVRGRAGGAASGRGRGRELPPPTSRRSTGPAGTAGMSRAEELVARSRQQTADIRQKQAEASGSQTEIETATEASPAQSPILPPSPSVGEAARIKRGPSAAEQGLVPQAPKPERKSDRGTGGARTEPENVFEKRGRRSQSDDKPRRRKTSPNQQRRRPSQPAPVQKRMRKLAVSKHLYYKVDVREIFAEENVPEEHRANLLGFTWSKGERISVQAATDYVREKQDEGALSERAAERIISILKRYTTRR